ncbi:hypothetical protein Poli38472_008869 [Pythium oligandrum]|uniref:protein-tyrosine-phosphatase n=1 Tax=Pythium oligandrum TaxID=41045 RepID=A0A8K1FBK0_PYTOL|nr:hypothetical protein Poli38472_008869 [Pythium oligandrum]|eukprot:TMW56221.1 hypothetical protein Poli38472_008869 [Pythium oligandrum]
MKRRSAVTTRPIEFFPRRFYLLLLRETPSYGGSSPASSSQLVFPRTPGIEFVALEDATWRAQSLDVANTLRFCRFLDRLRHQIPPSSPTMAQKAPQLHFYVRNLHLEAEMALIHLIARWRLLCLRLSPREALAPFQHLESIARPSMPLQMSLAGISKGVSTELLFTSATVEHQSQEEQESPDHDSAHMTHITKRFLIFAGPIDDIPPPTADSSASEQSEPPPATDPRPRLSVAQLVPVLKQNRVAMVVRLNATPTYDDQLIIRSGIEHLDLSSTDDTFDAASVARFLESCENAQGVVAVHSASGTGRAAFCVACFLVKHAQFTAAEAIGWIRFCRPGSIPRGYELLLTQMQASLWRDGDEYRRTMPENASPLTGMKEDATSNTRLTTHISIGKIALGRDSLLGTKEKTKEKENTPKTTARLIVQRSSGSYKDIPPTQELVATTEASLVRRRPLTQGALGRRRLIDRTSDGGSLRADFATMHKFLHQSSGGNGSATSRLNGYGSNRSDIDDVVIPPRPTATAPNRTRTSKVEITF